MQGKSKLRKPDYTKKLLDEMAKSILKYEIFVSSLTNATETEETPESAASTFTENEASTTVEAGAMDVDESDANVNANATDDLAVGEVSMNEAEATGRGHRQRKERQMPSMYIQ